MAWRLVCVECTFSQWPLRNAVALRGFIIWLLQKQSYIVSLLIFGRISLTGSFFASRELMEFQEFACAKMIQFFSRSIYVGNLQRSEAMLTSDQKPLGCIGGKKVNESPTTFVAFFAGVCRSTSNVGTSTHRIGQQQCTPKLERQVNEMPASVACAVCVCMCVCFYFFWSVSGVENLGPVQQMSAEARCQQ